MRMPPFIASAICLALVVVVLPVSAGELFPISEPGWEFSSSFLLLKQNRRENEELLFDGPGETSILSGNDFNLDYEPGIEFELSRELTDGLRISGGYFQMFEAEAEESEALPASTYFFRNPDNSSTDTLAGTDGFMILESQLHSAELNLEHDLNDYVTFLFGFRYLGFDDTLTFDFRNPANDQLFRWGTRNDLYGGQIGTEIALWEEDWFVLNFTGKFGVFNNQVDGEFLARDEDLNFDNYADESGEATSTVFDLHVEGIFRLTDHWSFLAGYRVIWVNDVAFSTEQVAGTSDFSGANERETMELAINDELFLHGFNFGFLCTW